MKEKEKSKKTGIKSPGPMSAMEKIRGQEYPFLLEALSYSSAEPGSFLGSATLQIIRELVRET